MIAQGHRPYRLRINQGTFDLLKWEGHEVERVKAQSGFALWLLSTPWGNVRCTRDVKLETGQFILERGWNDLPTELGNQLAEVSRGPEGHAAHREDGLQVVHDVRMDVVES